MNIFPNGFLSNVLCLRAVPKVLLSELHEAGDFSDAEAGEILLIPRVGGQGYSDRFVGIESLGEATVALVCESSGAELLVEARSAAGQLADDDAELEKEVFRQLLELSGRLQQLGCTGALRLVSRGNQVYLAPPAGKPVALEVGAQA